MARYFTTIITSAKFDAWTGSEVWAKMKELPKIRTQRFIYSGYALVWDTVRVEGGDQLFSGTLWCPQDRLGRYGGGCSYDVYAPMMGQSILVANHTGMRSYPTGEIFSFSPSRNLTVTLSGQDLLVAGRHVVTLHRNGSPIWLTTVGKEAKFVVGGQTLYFTGSMGFYDDGNVMKGTLHGGQQVQINKRAITVQGSDDDVKTSVHGSIAVEFHRNGMIRRCLLFCSEYFWAPNQKKWIHVFSGGTIVSGDGGLRQYTMVNLDENGYLVNAHHQPLSGPIQRWAD